MIQDQNTDKMSDVIDLDAKRAKRAGLEFALVVWEFNDKDVALVADDAAPVAIVLPDSNQGLAMSAGDARLLAVALVEAADAADRGVHRG